MTLDRDTLTICRGHARIHFLSHSTDAGMLLAIYASHWILLFFSYFIYTSYITGHIEIDTEKRKFSSKYF